MMSLGNRRLSPGDVAPIMFVRQSQTRERPAYAAEVPPEATMIPGFGAPSRRLLSLPLALLHKASLRGAGQGLAFAAHGLGQAGVALAFLQEARLGGAGQRLAVFAHGFALAGFLRRREGEIQGQHYGSKQNPLHVSLL